MDSPENARLPNAHCHASKAGIEQMHDVASLGTVFADDGALSPAVDEGLHRLAVYLNINIKHCNATKQLGSLFHRFHVVLLNHTFSDFFFNLLLSFNVVGVCITQLHHSLLFLSFLLHHLLHALFDDPFDLLSAIFPVTESRSKLGVVLGQSLLEVSIGVPALDDLHRFLTNALRLCVVEHLIEQLLLRQTGSGFFCSFEVAEEVLHQVLVGSTEVRDAQVNHIVVLNAK